MIARRQIAPETSAWIACLASIGAWLCLLIGTWMAWRKMLGDSVWDLLLSAWSFFGNLPDLTVGGRWSGSASAVGGVLEILCLGLATAGLWLARRNPRVRMTNIAIGLSVTLLGLALVSMALQAVLYVWLKDTHWR
nr:hypothetical protein [Dyella sp. ASV24]